MIDVIDEVIGIPEEDLPHLFETFHRAKNVGKVKGTGIGLSIVEQYTTLHGGNVSAKSQLNKGSRFTVQLPAILLGAD